MPLPNVVAHRYTDMHAPDTLRHIARQGCRDCLPAHHSAVRSCSCRCNHLKMKEAQKLLINVFTASYVVHDHMHMATDHGYTHVIGRGLDPFSIGGGSGRPTGGQIWVQNLVSKFGFASHRTRGTPPGTPTCPSPKKFTSRKAKCHNAVV